MKNEYKSKMEQIHMSEERKMEIHSRLEKQCRIKNTTGKRTFVCKPAILAASLALIFVVGGTVVFARGNAIQKWIRSLGHNSDVAKSYVMTTVDAEYEENTPWLTIEDVYLDGCLLVFTAKLSDQSKGIPVDISDHATINGVDCRTETFEPLDEDIYQGIIYIPEEMLNEDYSGKKLTVETVLLLSNETGERKDFVFTIPADTMNIVQQNTETVDIIENGERIGSVVAEYRKSPSGLFLNLDFTFTGENAKENLKKYMISYGLDTNEEYIEYIFADDQGDWENIPQSKFSGGPTELMEGEKNCSQGLEMEITEFPYESNSITIIPYVYHVREDGKPIYDVDENHNIIYDKNAFRKERSITIPLNP